MILHEYNVRGVSALAFCVVVQVVFLYYFYRENVLYVRQTYLHGGYRNRRYVSFNCSKLFSGDKIETKKATRYVKKFPYSTALPEDFFIKATNNCTRYKRGRGYTTDSTEDEQSYPIAYSILVHEYIEQFDRLLRAIYRPQNYYCIHVDLKSPPKFHAATKAIASCFENVFIASKLEVVVYSGFTRLQADLNCMDELYSKYRDWKYLLNGAGTEFPLKTNEELVRLLQMCNGSNIIEKNGETEIIAWRWEKRYETTVTNLSGSIKQSGIPNPPPPFNLSISIGSAYAAFSRDYVDYVLHDPVPKEYLEWCRHTYSPDEHYWATLDDLNSNPQLKTPGGGNEDRRSRTVLWYSKDCHGTEIRGVCVFGVGDLPWLSIGTGLFANKFNLLLDDIAYSCMEDLLKLRETHSTPRDMAHHSKYLAKHITKTTGRESILTTTNRAERRNSA